MDYRLLDFAIRHITGNLEESEQESIDNLLDFPDQQQIYTDMSRIWYIAQPRLSDFEPKKAWREWQQNILGDESQTVF
ncbi:MAG TPA: hypothetical protein PKA00_01005 [Saprospiraceae bacterium]|nr:hypothetical protein [Saprospiraceae bacterium]HMQ81445.1 hypothetical protein [Saprospiraceae bacterium]